MEDFIVHKTFAYLVQQDGIHAFILIITTYSGKIGVGVFIILQRTEEVNKSEREKTFRYFFARRGIGTA